jgi:hypothetical protein
VTAKLEAVNGFCHHGKKKSFIPLFSKDGPALISARGHVINRTRVLYPQWPGHIPPLSFRITPEIVYTIIPTTACRSLKALFQEKKGSLPQLCGSFRL